MNKEQSKEFEKFHIEMLERDIEILKTSGLRESEYRFAAECSTCVIQYLYKKRQEEEIHEIDAIGRV